MSKSIAESRKHHPFSRFGFDIDNIFDDWARTPNRVLAKEDGSFSPSIDIKEQTDRYVVATDLPGVRKEDIDVTVSDGVLTINAETKSDDEQKDENERVIRRERQVGKYVRSITLGGEVVEDKVTAKFTDGVLTLTLPKAKETLPTKIAVNVA